MQKWYEQNGAEKQPKVNGHIHTPFSFSAFESIFEAFELAQEEGVKVLGINDFYVTDGYESFHDQAVKNKVFPLFNIEFMALQKDLQANGVRVNDPSNPGRTYFSGKGLTYPVQLNEEIAEKLAKLKVESNLQTQQMVEKLDAHLNEVGVALEISFESIKNDLAEELVRERHIAKAIRLAVFEKFGSDEERKGAFQKIFGGKELKADVNKISAVENEIRGCLLKTGGAAFVPESDEAFYSLEAVKEIIISAGGIPCYPVLLDDANGNFTDFEGDWEAMQKSLKEKGIGCVELIPSRNSLKIFNEFVQSFHDAGFVVLMGTEHNTPEMTPLTLDCRGEKLTDELEKTGYEGACVVAAHQYLIAKGQEGFVDAQGCAKMEERETFVALGNAVIAYFFQS
ncbi:hypothetical protein EYV94_22655 [Puteibacter caeruleilacunae]|nr:hypothetical protein EYV94_22655 [Puteibacter caeruleilacunae]